MMIAKLKMMLVNAAGAATVEFALYSTVFFAMLFGGLYASMLGYASATLHHSVEAAARCRAMGITCTDATTTQTYAAAQFKNLTGSTPTFTSVSDTCGQKVTGTVNLKLNWILSSSTIPMSATACFPSA
jgi:Flp pilus assembly protein TadG